MRERAARVLWWQRTCLANSQLSRSPRRTVTQRLCRCRASFSLTSPCSLTHSLTMLDVATVQSPVRTEWCEGDPRGSTSYPNSQQVEWWLVTDESERAAQRQARERELAEMQAHAAEMRSLAALLGINDEYSGFNMLYPDPPIDTPSHAVCSHASSQTQSSTSHAPNKKHTQHQGRRARTSCMPYTRSLRTAATDPATGRLRITVAWK